MNGQGRVVLSSDATQALLFEDNEQHADVLKLLDEAETKGLIPLYNILVFAILDYELLKAGKVENRMRLANFMTELAATSFLTVPNEEDIVSGFEVYEEESKHRKIPYVDFIGVAMSARLEAKFLSLDHDSTVFWTLYSADKLLDKINNRTKPPINERKGDVPV